MSEETEDPRRKIPLAIMLCALAGGAVYVFQSYLGHLAFPDFASFADDQDVASADVMKEIGNDFLNSFFTAAYVAACFACAMASQASVSRILYAMGRDGSLPKTGVRPAAPQVPVAGGGEPRRRRVRPHRAVHQPGDRVLDDLLRRPGGVLVREPGGDQDLRDRSAGSAAEPNSSSTACCPFLGFAFTIYLWTKLSGVAFEVGLTWLAVGFVYLLVLTRGFRKPPPAMYTGDEDDVIEPAPA